MELGSVLPLLAMHMHNVHTAVAMQVCAETETESGFQEVDAPRFQDTGHKFTTEWLSMFKHAYVIKKSQIT